MDFSDYVGVDVVRYDDFPTGSEFHPVDLNAMEWALSGLQADVVVAVETIEHLENPRAFFRSLGRLAKPGGWVLVSTPNNLSGLSKLTLLTKNCFNAFQNNQYPAHLTALLEIDLRRMAQETGMEEVTVAYTEKGRIPGTSWHYPSWLSRSASQTFSDNVLLLGRKIL
jgi:SAM-dependent methyltransferase